MEPVDACDYLLILNMPEQPVTTCLPREHVWAIMQEPPNEVFRRMHRGRRQYHRVYTQHPRLTGRKYIHSQPAIAWHVDRDYDFLKDCPIPHKTAAASCITSAKTDFRGHVERLNFVQKLQKTVEFDLFGRGFREIADKWDGLAPYRYSIAIENFRNDWYWSEKIADCFLAWTMPIYYGCPRIAEYFPAESLVSIDIRDPDATRIVQETIRSDRWLRNIDAIAEARRLVLERHQLFSFVAQEIRRYEEGMSNPPRPCGFTSLTSYLSPSTWKGGCSTRRSKCVSFCWLLRQIVNPVDAARPRSRIMQTPPAQARKRLLLAVICTYNQPRLAALATKAQWQADFSADAP